MDSLELALELALGLYFFRILLLANMPTANIRCLFFDLPLELRLLIYDCALFDQKDITIASASDTGIGLGVFGDGDSGYASDPDSESGQAAADGLPPNQLPIVAPCYQPRLLQPVLEFPHAAADDSFFLFQSPNKKARTPDHNVGGRLPFASPLALRLTNRQVNRELKWHLHTQQAQARKYGLYLSYPHGLAVFESQCPDLVHVARSIHISGVYYRASKHNHDRSSRWRQRYDNTDSVYKAANRALGRIARTTMLEDAKAPIDFLEVRIFYPGDRGYRILWEDDDSPTTIAMRNVAYGQLENCVWTGNGGAGADLLIFPRGGRRVVVQRWRKLRERSSSRGSDADDIASWVVNPKWPWGVGNAPDFEAQ
ncbi:uncharacterized protein IWZ02DRAFT_443892 [Phyllosticta citriasiana]|uniref:F-box domain-containing protein n=1 Tax=Phyllosticta citriasiana TaxID=595635 RepID=A0ABR1KMF3_9PEZI